MDSDQVSKRSAASDMDTKLILVTGATGDTGRPTVKLLLERGHRVRALARKQDARSRALQALGADVVFGDMLMIGDIRAALKGVRSAYFVYPLAHGQVEASVIFAKAAEEEGLELVVNMSHKQSRPFARSQATMAHWLSEQVFDWSGIPVTHLRITFFAEWILYISALIRKGRYVVPFDGESRFAPIASSDIARIVVGLLENPAKHVGQALSLHGPVEYSHVELAALIARVLGKNVRFEQVSTPEFLELLGIPNDTAKGAHFEAVKIDQQEGLLSGTDSLGSEIAGGPLMTMEEFVANHRAQLM